MTETPESSAGTAARASRADRADRADSAVETATETAWRIHTSLSDWTGKVDNKAVFALSIESAMLAGTAVLSSGPNAFLDLAGTPAAWLTRIGVILLALSVLLAVAVVIPRTRGALLRVDWPENFTYFGHLRLWEPDALAEHLRTADPLGSLSRQLVTMSKVAWRKALLVKLSLIIAPAGAVCTVAAGLLG
jgi:hypothetical protein